MLYPLELRALNNLRVTDLRLYVKLHAIGFALLLLGSDLRSPGKAHAGILASDLPPNRSVNCRSQIALGTRSMSSIKRDVKKKAPPRSEE